MRNQTTTLSAPGQSILSKAMCFVFAKDKTMSSIFSANLTHAFTICMLAAVLCAGAAIIIENEDSFNGWCVLLWVVSVFSSVKAARMFLCGSNE